MKCPYCGSKKLNKTFNFNEYNCSLCECYFKPTTSGLKIFQDGSWKKFCESIYENIKKHISDANYINFIHNVTNHYSKTGPENIDLLVEEYEKLAINLLNEHKVGLRNKEDFNVVYNEIVKIVECAKTLSKRSDDLNIKIRLTEEMKDFVGDDENELEIADAISDEAIEYLEKNKQEINDENIIKFVDKNHPQHKDLLHSIINLVREKSGLEVEEEVTQENISEEDDEELIGENILYEEDEIKDDIKTDENNNEENSEKDTDIDLSSVEDDLKDDENAESTEDSTDSTEESSTEDSDDNQQNTTSLSDIKSEIEDLKSKLDNILNKINNSESSDSNEENQEEQQDDSQDSTNELENIDDSDESLEDSDSENADNEKDNSSEEEKTNNIQESEKKKKLVANRSGYKRKISNREAEKKNPFQTDMTAEEEDEEIPFTVRERTRMKKMGLNTENDLSGGILKNTENKPVYAYKPGDSVFVEGFKEPLTIKHIAGNIFTLEKGKFSTKININETKIRHADRNLEWESESKQIRSLQKKWNLLKNLYLKEEDESLKVSGVVGLGGGNRLGGEKFDQEPIIDDPQDNTNLGGVSSSREEIYQFIKDNNVHKMYRGAAVEYLMDKFTNPREEIENILDDAILSLDPSKEPHIDANYNYQKPKSGLDLQMDLKNKWNSIEQEQNEELQSEIQSRPLNTQEFITPYESPEDDKLNVLDKSYKNILKDV